MGTSWALLLDSQLLNTGKLRACHAWLPRRDAKCAAHKEMLGKYEGTLRPATHLLDEAGDGGDQLQLRGHLLQLHDAGIVQRLAIKHRPRDVRRLGLHG